MPVSTFHTSAAQQAETNPSSPLPPTRIGSEVEDDVVPVSRCTHAQLASQLAFSRTMARP